MCWNNLMCSYSAASSPETDIQSQLKIFTSDLMLSVWHKSQGGDVVKNSCDIMNAKDKRNDNAYSENKCGFHSKCIKKI